MNDRLAEVRAAIGALDEPAMAAARSRQAQLTKPAGSLGRLEELAVQVVGITGAASPNLARRAVIVMAADHGVTAEGVSAYPADVTVQMVANFLGGGAAINVLARAVGARVVVVDIGVRSHLAPAPGLVSRKVRPGTANFVDRPAMTDAEAHAAIGVGLDVLDAEHERGLDVVLTGEMGIGNTTAASAMVAALTGLPVAAVTGHGTGIDSATYERKIAVIGRALAYHRLDRSEPIDLLAAVGGLEIAGLVGVILGAAAHRIPIVVDGFIAGAAALVAMRLAPMSAGFMIASHRSVEPGHIAVLSALGLRPLLDLQLRLGEGTGAALALPIIDVALRLHNEMATFDEAKVSRGSTASG